MKMVKLAACSAILASATLVGCATNEEAGTVVGAGAGALAGYAIAPNSALGPVIGAGAGAIVGHTVGRDMDRDNYYRYHHKRYHKRHHHYDN